MLDSFGAGVVITIAAVTIFIKYFVSHYLLQKSKNLATKEDVAEITNQIELVKSHYASQLQIIAHQNSLLLEEVKGRNQLRVAALEKRLEVHQEAFTLWRKLMTSMHSDSVGDTVMECQEWWNNNCLYLSSEARQAFSGAYHCAHMHSGLTQGSLNAELAKKNWLEIIEAGNVILKSMELPPLEDKDIELLSSDK